MQHLPRVVCAILGGGRGTRLYPLTKERCKPAVPLGGKYRLIDIPISNCLNSGYGRIFVLTQFNTASLHRHIARSYPFDALSGRSVQILAAEQTLERADWYQGTADAIRQNLRHLGLDRAEHVLILSGDHLYRMNYGEMIRRHVEARADITVAVKPVAAAEARSFGVVKLTGDGMICDFVEKPQDEATLAEFALSEPAGRDPETGEALTHVASMGIYCFRPDVLRRLLTESDADDFGKHIIPQAIASQRVAAFGFSGYWEDIGTIPAFYRANLELAAPVPRFNLFDSSWPIYTRARYLPPAKVSGARVEQALVADGAIVGRADVVRSIVGLRAVIADEVVVEDSVVMGNDFYEPQPPEKQVALGIGRGCVLRGAIIDKNVRIGEGVRIEGRPGSGVDQDGQWHCVRDGIVIIPRSQVVPPGTEIVV